jgi:hypothetical protein
MKHVFALFLTLFLGAASTAQAATTLDIGFPLDGEATYTNDFFDARSGGRSHNATDLMAPKMTPVLAANAGVVTWAPMTQPYYGYMLTIQGDDGYKYNYVHLNNDNPGTDDGRGGSAQAYAAGIKQGVHVERGQHLGWVGDSGNAEGTPAHLHFEIYDGGSAINPYELLVTAGSKTGVAQLASTVVLADVSFDPATQLALATSISDDKNLDHENGDAACEADSLIRTELVSTVYYCGTDGGRYVFQNESVFLSWYQDFEAVTFVSAEDMASIPLAGNVTYKPGSFMIKLLSSPKVYAVGQAGTLHWVETAAMAESMYGPSWATMVRDIPDGFWGAYEVGEDVTSD